VESVEYALNSQNRGHRMTSSSPLLTTADHRRDIAGLTYVYPVISRRAGGVSVGVNLNPNNACNWRCVYCQVPGLVRGGAPRIDVALLESELRGFFDELLRGDFMARRVPPPLRRLTDVAFSGNGEPTSARAFGAAVEIVGNVLEAEGLAGKIKLVLITNGSLLHRTAVQAALTRMARWNGEVWFKLDRATRSGMAQINGVRPRLSQVQANLRAAAARCPTWLQTCLFAWDGQPPPRDELDAYLRFVEKQCAEEVCLKGVLLYGLARPSMQIEAPRLSPLPPAWMASFAAEIATLGIAVNVSP